MQRESRPGLRLAVSAVLAVMCTAGAIAAPAVEFASRDAVSDWMDGYRHRPEPQRLPAAMRALVRANAFRDPETSGFHVGFIAGVLGSDPARAEAIARRMLPLLESDQWVLVRAIAYSGLPEWKALLRRVGAQLPARQTMIAQHLAGKLPTLETIELDRLPTLLERVQTQVTGRPHDAGAFTLGRNPETVDTLWGYYIATGAYRPVQRIVAVLPWSKDRDSIARLTVGMSAKYTLASNAARYPDLLAMLKRTARYQPAAAQPPLREVIVAAETMQAPQIRRDGIAAIEELRRKGPATRRQMTVWGTIGQGAVALGCIGLAAAGQVAFALPCVIGGAASSAAMNYWTAQP